MIDSSDEGNSTTFIFLFDFVGLGALSSLGSLSSLGAFFGGVAVLSLVSFSDTSDSGGGGGGGGGTFHRRAPWSNALDCG